MKFIKPRLVLMGFISGVVLFSILAMVLKGDAAVASINLVLFFESCIFPLIMTLSLRGLGRHSKRGASILVAAVSGGALFPPVLGVVADSFGGNTQKAFFIPLIGFAIAFTYPLYLNIFKRRSLDAWTDKVKIGTTSDLEASSTKGSVRESQDETRK